jgi:2-keto-4-pentenoate hydratase
MVENKLTLAKGSILFSSSATDGIPMQAGKKYVIAIESLGSIDLRVS